eukprot:TRINITY_DN644_c0_g1_i1.p1 TRINITY_DN644_c0_g1~~TRINITY_DN644_c0_g1_i1.p1  ORF type:complete len:231 (-),score=50.69 TRINITY_DN644_c0_g1_i1:53-745(-)
MVYDKTTASRTNNNIKTYLLAFSKDPLVEKHNYAEFKILKLNDRGERSNWEMGFGIARNNINRENYLTASSDGWGFFCGSNSYGSHRDNGTGIGTNFWGEMFDEGDTVGVLFEKNEKNDKYILSFSINGKNLGAPFEDITFQGAPLHFVAHLCPNTAVQYIPQEWSEENHKYFSSRIQNNIKLFLLILKRWKSENAIVVPKRLAKFLLLKIGNVVEILDQAALSANKSKC